MSFGRPKLVEGKVYLKQYAFAWSPFSPRKEMLSGARTGRSIHRTSSRNSQEQIQLQTDILQRPMI